MPSPRSQRSPTDPRVGAAVTRCIDHLADDLPELLGLDDPPMLRLQVAFETALGKALLTPHPSTGSTEKVSPRAVAEIVSRPPERKPSRTNRKRTGGTGIR
jgi:hypothetical protein